MKKVYRTDEEKQEILAAIDADIENGTPIIEAARKHGIAKARYYQWRKVTPKVKVIEHEPLPKAQRKSCTKRVSGQPLTLIVGSPSELAAFYREIRG